MGQYFVSDCTLTESRTSSTLIRARLVEPRLSLILRSQLSRAVSRGIGNYSFCGGSFASLSSSMKPAVMMPAGSAMIAIPKTEEIIVTSLPIVVTG